MQVGEWYTNPNSKMAYVIRILTVTDSFDKKQKVLEYFHISDDKRYGVKINVFECKMKNYTLIEDQEEIDRLETYFKKYHGPSDEDKFKLFIKTL